MTWTVLSVGGSMVVPDIPDIKFLKKFKAMIKPLLKKSKFALVVGGGKQREITSMQQQQLIKKFQITSKE